MWHFKAVVILSTTRFIIQNFYIQPTQCVLMFYANLRTKQRLFPYTALNDWFYNREEEWRFLDHTHTHTHTLTHIVGLLRTK